MLKYIQLSSYSRNELIDITPNVVELVKKSGVLNGVVYLCCLHTTAGITINEGADPGMVPDAIFRVFSNIWCLLMHLLTIVRETPMPT